MMIEILFQTFSTQIILPLYFLNLSFLLLLVLLLLLSHPGIPGMTLCFCTGWYAAAAAVAAAAGHSYLSTW